MIRFGRVVFVLSIPPMLSILLLLTLPFILLAGQDSRVKDNDLPLAFAETSSTHQVAILVDDFSPQPRPGASQWPHNRLGGDRGPLGDAAGVEWRQGTVKATILAGSTSAGVWTALNHPIREHAHLNFSSLFPPQILPAFQGQITDLEIQLSDAHGTFLVELKAQNPLLPGQEIVKWSQSVAVNGASTLHFSLPNTLGEIQNLNWLVSGSAGDFVVVDRIIFTATLPFLDTPQRAFLWSYSMLLANWDPASGLTRDHAYWAAGEFDNVSASGMQAAAAVMAWRLGFISKESAVDIVSRTSQALLALPRDNCGGKLWPHFVSNGQIIPGTEWSSIDTVIAAVALIEARQGLDLDTTAVEAILNGITWDNLVLPDDHISHGYRSDCTRIETDGTGGWQDFGTESWLVNLGYAAAKGQLAEFDHTPPTANGSGFIDELAWLLMPSPCRDRWGTRWCDYREQAAAKQFDYYQDQPCYQGPPRRFGLSAAEIPNPSTVPISESVYRAFGVGGETPTGAPVPANDGQTDPYLLHPVIVPHYAALVASLRPDQARAFWEWLELTGLFTPLNNVESLMFTDEPACTDMAWNDLKGSWNLSLQTLSWGRFLAGSNNPLYQALGDHEMLRRGFRMMAPCHWGPENPPTSAIYDLDQDVEDWGIFCEEPAPGGWLTWNLTNTSTSSLDGSSLQCSIMGGAPYSNIHCYRNLLPEPQAGGFTLTIPFLFTSTQSAGIGVCNGPDSVVQALEFTMSKWRQGIRHEFALQWQNVGPGAPQWRYWDPHQPESWVAFNPQLPTCLATGQWHTLILTGEISQGRVHYQSFTIDQQSHNLDLFTLPACEVGADRLAVAIQLDGNFQEDPYSVFIDQVSFVRRPISQAELASPMCVYLPVIRK